MPGREASPNAASEPAPDAPRVPTRLGLRWGCGGLADNIFYNLLNQFGLFFYSTYLGLDPLLASVALLVPRLVDTIADPWIGHWSDRARTPWGRRRPFMWTGAAAAAVLLPLLWSPVARDTAAAPWYANGPFWYLTLAGCLHAFAYGLYVVPYTALGYELAAGATAAERTRVMAWRMYVGLLGSLALPWLYRLSLGFSLGPIHIEFPNVGAGAQCVTVALCLVALGSVWIVTARAEPGLAAARAKGLDQEDSETGAAASSARAHGEGTVGDHEGGATRSRARTSPSLSGRKEALLALFRLGNASPAFRRLLLGYASLVIAVFMGVVLQPFLLLHRVFGGNAVAAGSFHGWLGTTLAVMSYVSLILTTFAVRAWGPRKALRWALLLVLGAVVANGWLYDPQHPLHRHLAEFGRVLCGPGAATDVPYAGGVPLPWGLLATMLVTGLALQGIWLLSAVLVGECCEEEARKSGRRRDGWLSALVSVTLKLSQAAALLLSGVLVKAVGLGWREGLTAARTIDDAAATVAWNVSAGERLTLALVLLQTIGLLVALVCFWRRVPSSATGGGAAASIPACANAGPDTPP